MTNEPQNQKGWNSNRSRTFIWVRFIVFVVLFGCIELGGRRGYYDLKASQYLIATLCIAGFIWFWMISTSEERCWPRKTVAAEGSGDKKVWLAYVYVYTALAATIGLIGSGAILLPDYTLLLHAQATGGVIVKASCKQHATVIYSYEVAGRSLTGQDQPSSGICSPSLVHAQVKVWYRSDRPEITRLSDPSRILRNDGAALALAVIIFPALILFSVWVKRNARRRKVAWQNS